MTHTATRPTKTPYRRRRQRRTIITLILVTALLVGALVVSYGYVQGWLGKPPATTPRACLRTSTVTASQVTLNVYNGTQKAGLARKTADSLKKRGFKIAAVANDPLEKKLAGASEVRYGPAGAPAAKLVGAQLKGARMVRDQRTSSTLDIVVGDKFSSLAPQPKPAKSATSKGSSTSKAKGKNKSKGRTASTRPTPAPSSTCSTSG